VFVVFAGVNKGRPRLAFSCLLHHHVIITWAAMCRPRCWQPLCLPLDSAPGAVRCVRALRRLGVRSTAPCLCVCCASMHTRHPLTFVDDDECCRVLPSAVSTHPAARSQPGGPCAPASALVCVMCRGVRPLACLARPGPPNAGTLSGARHLACLAGCRS
jgi:hypothetical protein